MDDNGDSVPLEPESYKANDNKIVVYLGVPHLLR